MLNDWFRTIRLNITWSEYKRLPRHPAYKQEYLEDRCYLTPRPKCYHAMLDLAAFVHPTQAALDGQWKPVNVRRLEDGDWESLPSLLAAAFHRVPPFASLSDKRAVVAAKDCLDYTRGGGDGPLVREACSVATAEDGDVVGALLITLWPDKPLEDWYCEKWSESPPADAVERRLGRPHVTWVFVSPWRAGHGIGTAMLSQTVTVLREMGYRELATSFISGNDSSMLWHWRNGFRLVEYAGSYRAMDRKILARHESQQTDSTTTPPM
jgi:ribosomal protein S18 acetylase RimI-like enzyme